MACTQQREELRPAPLKENHWRTGEHVLNDNVNGWRVQSSPERWSVHPWITQSWRHKIQAYKCQFIAPGSHPEGSERTAPVWKCGTIVVYQHIVGDRREGTILNDMEQCTHPFPQIGCCLWRGKNQKHFSLETFPSLHVVFLSRTSVVIRVSFPSLDTRLNRREGKEKGRGSREKEEERREGWRENGREQEGRKEEGRNRGREKSLLSTYQAIEITRSSSLIRDQIPLLERGRWPHTWVAVHSPEECHCSSGSKMRLTFSNNLYNDSWELQWWRGMLAFLCAF